jgi:hypothetical protein
VVGREELKPLQVQLVVLVVVVALGLIYLATLVKRTQEALVPLDKDLQVVRAVLDYLVVMVQVAVAVELLELELEDNPDGRHLLVETVA